MNSLGNDYKNLILAFNGRLSNALIWFMYWNWFMCLFLELPELSFFQALAISLVFNVGPFTITYSITDEPSSGEESLNLLDSLQGQISITAWILLAGFTLFMLLKIMAFFEILTV